MLLTTASVMNSLLGVGGHLLSRETGEFLYTVFRYVRQWEIAEEVAGGQELVGAIERVPTCITRIVKGATL